MFAKGASGGHVFTSMYKNVEEDFGNEDASKLDTWVFNEVRGFFGSARKNETLKKMLHKRQIVFFLHLLGMIYFVNTGFRLDFCRSLVSGLPSPRRTAERVSGKACL